VERRKNGSVEGALPVQNVRVDLPTVLRIHDILVQIRIRGSLPLTNGCTDSDPSIFVNDLQDANKKQKTLRV
jgi:hypothetical protein